MNQTQALQLLKESILTVGVYELSEEFKQSNSIAIELNQKPILLLGYEGDKESDDIANRLLKSDQFLKLVMYEFGHVETLKKTVVVNKDVCVNPSYKCITKSEQGLEEDGSGTGQLVAVNPDNKDAFGFGICVNNEIMKCFYPDAKDLSAIVVLHEAY